MSNSWTNGRLWTRLSKWRIVSASTLTAMNGEIGNQRINVDFLRYPYAGQRDISSNEAQAYSCMMVMANGFANAVRGNWTALHLLAAGRLGNKLKPPNMNTNYTGPGGPMVFDDNGDVVYG